MFFILLVEFNHVVMEYGARQLFSIPALCLYSGEKIGIVGENGTGKTTLLDMIAGKTMPASGTVNRYGRISYITQNPTERPAKNDTHQNYLWQVPRVPHSGGEVTRAKIARALEESAPLLVCDEPTSNLDEKGIRQLENALSRYKGAVLLVSHDRALIDQVCTKIWEIQGGQLTVFSGNYSDYQIQKQRLKQNQQKEYDKYIDERKSLENALYDRNKRANGMTKTPSRMGNSEARLHRMEVRQKAGKVSGDAKNIKRRIAHLEAKEKPRPETDYHMLAAQAPKKSGKIAARIAHLSFAYGDSPILNDVSFIVNSGDKVCIEGENGTGKTTLLACIARGVEGVKIGHPEEVGYFTQNGLDLDERRDILAFVMAKSKLPEHETRTVLAELGIKRGDVYKKITNLSGGEKSKVALASLLCRQCTLLILDEPTNYLDIYILEALEKMLTRFSGTLIFVTHDRRFRQRIASQILTLENGKLHEKALQFSDSSRNQKAQIFKLELKAAKLIETKKGLSGEAQEKLEQEYLAVTAELQALKREGEQSRRH